MHQHILKMLNPNNIQNYVVHLCISESVWNRLRDLRGLGGGRRRKTNKLLAYMYYGTCPISEWYGVQHRGYHILKIKSH